MFEEISPREYENVDKTKYPYLFSGDEETVIPDRLYKHNDYLIGLTLSLDVAFIDILCLGEKENILSECRDLLKRLFKIFNYIGFYYPEGYKTEILVKRMIKKHKIIHDSSVDGFKTTIIEEV